MAGLSCQEGPDPGDQVVINLLGAQGGSEDVGVDVVKATLNIKKQR